MKPRASVALAAGIVIVVGLVVWQGADGVAAALSGVGFGLFAVAAFHALPIALAGAAWAALVASPAAPGLGRFVTARWIREAVNTLLPVAQIGGDIVGARLLVRAGGAGRAVAAGTVADKTIEALSQAVVAGAALAILIDGDGAGALLTPLLIAAALVGGFVLAQRWGALRLAERMLVRLARAAGGSGEDFRGLHEAVWAVYRDRRRTGGAVLLHGLAWACGAVEMWMILHFMGHPVGFATAFAVEALGQAARSAAFAIPGALGAQEAAYMALAQAVGLTPETGLAVSLVKRGRHLLVGVPALLAWQRLEWRAGRPARPAPLPRAVARDARQRSWNRRAARALLAPLVGSQLTPNHITAGRWLCAIAACVCFARAEWPWGAGFWTVSTFLDRCDGEFARMTGLASRAGMLLDLAGDVLFNSAVFPAIGLGLLAEPWAHHVASLPAFAWPLCGVVASLAVLAASVLAERNEQDMRDGEKTFNGRWGLEFDDFIYLIGAFVIAGVPGLLLLGGAVGGLAAALAVGGRLAGRKTAPRES